MASKFEYIPVQNGDSQSESDSEYSHTYRPQRQRQWTLISISVLIAILLSFLLGLAIASLGIYSIIPHSRTIPKAMEGTDMKTNLPLAWSNGDCGNSASDAISRGCKYSIVLHSWLPESCLTQMDIEDAEEMYTGREWSFVTSSGHNLTMQELSQGDYGHFTTSFDWHVAHCMFVWKRLHRILLDAELELDSYTANYHHTSHCVKMIGGQPEGMKDSGTKIFVKYPRCAK